MKALLKQLKNDRYLPWVIILAAIFFVATSWFYFGSDGKFTSPDETANYFFAQHFAHEGSYSYTFSQEDNTIGNYLPYPRSTKLAGDELISASFIGLPLLYGLIAKLFGSGTLIFLTPLFASVAIVFFYLLLSYIFSRYVSFLSTLLIFSVTSFWHYASRGMFHNVLFLSLLIIGIYFLLKAILGNNKESSNTYWPVIISGILLGYALVVRSSEVVWVTLFIVGPLWFVLFKRKNKTIALIFVVCFIAAFIPMFAYNAYYFGSPFAFGYTANSVQSETVASGPTSSVWQQLLLPFGFEWKQMQTTVSQYLFEIIPWLSTLLILGVGLFIQRVILDLWHKFFQQRKRVKLSLPIRWYGLSYLGLSLVLIGYYGSYRIQEYIDPNQIILGSSHFRYWLPIFIFGLPLVVWLLLFVSRQFSNTIGRYIVGGLMIVMIMLSIVQVYTDEIQGLTTLQSNNKEARQSLEVVQDHIDSQAVVITNEFDKLFFPEFHVFSVLPHEDSELQTLVEDVLSKRTLYYYHSPLNTSLGYLFEKLPTLGHRLEMVEISGDGAGVLYQVLRN